MTVLPDPSLDALSEVVSRHRQQEWTRTAVPRLSLIAADSPTPASEISYEPMVCFLAEGRKRVTLQDQLWAPQRGDAFFSSFEVPVLAVLESAPYRCAMLHLDRVRIAELLLEFEDALPHLRKPAMTHSGQLVTAMTTELAEAVLRWVRLLDSPQDISPLAPRLEAEVLYRLLQGPLSTPLRQFAAPDSAMTRIHHVVKWLQEHSSERVSIEDMSEIAHMSQASLHRHFKAATGMSPIRFQKKTRLRNARRLLLTERQAVASVARQVGYASPSQFSREYAREYGRPPMQDIASLRGAPAR